MRITTYCDYILAHTTCSDSADLMSKITVYKKLSDTVYNNACKLVALKGGQK